MIVLEAVDFVGIPWEKVKDKIKVTITIDCDEEEELAEIVRFKAIESGIYLRTV